MEVSERYGTANAKGPRDSRGALPRGPGVPGSRACGRPYALFFSPASFVRTILNERLA